MEDARKPQPPFELKAAPIHRDFDLRADARSLFEQVAKQYGLDVVFDGDYQPGPSSGSARPMSITARQSMR